MASSGNGNRQDATSRDWKLSSSDLHSRLKTRKVLGVGETDDGDVHRSKLSQILGHSDQLYVKLPWGLRAWQFVLALSFTIVSLWALILPSHIFDVTFEADEGKYVALPVRFYGIALLALSLFHWNALGCGDRDVIRISLLSSVIYFSLQTFVTFLSLASSEGGITSNALVLLGFRVTSAFLSALYYHAVVCKTGSLRPKSMSSDNQQGGKRTNE
ncbi:tumor protein p53-inducible protein 11-like isoform X2 [Littorina saxatilis]|uniref:tumor protein p53-inducible protein 11-like isoform X2 n=1 Tax=Littorina saxatilis TaxID=31220 RepID=UPI0038B55ABE